MNPAAHTIGPNAIVQTIGALTERYGELEAAAVLTEAAIGYTVERVPRTLVDERAFARLAQAVIARYGETEARIVFEESGRRTAEYVLANRLPKAIQTLIRSLPAPAGTWLLLRAIGSNASTFGASGTYAFELRPNVRIRVANPAFVHVPGVCRYYAGAFTRLLQSLVDARLTLVEETCEREGNAACTFLAFQGNTDGNAHRT